MLRRLIALVAAAFVLFGAISPALACARNEGDCCPAGAPKPCREDRSLPLSDRVEACCSTPAQAVSASVSMSREKTGQSPHPIGSPDPLIAALWLVTLTPPAHFSTAPPPLLASASGDGGLTYLRTMRLRL